eukprot:7386428-Prymnesium_polylepis.1
MAYSYALRPRNQSIDMKWHCTHTANGGSAESGGVAALQEWRGRSGRDGNVARGVGERRATSIPCGGSPASTPTTSRGPARAHTRWLPHRSHRALARPRSASGACTRSAAAIPRVSDDRTIQQTCRKCEGKGTEAVLDGSKMGPMRFGEGEPPQEGVRRTFGGAASAVR